MATDHLAHLTADAARLVAVLRSTPPATAVTHCPGWDLGALTRHLGAIHRWATHVVRTGEKVPLPADEVDDADLARWCADGVEDLLAVLAGSDPEASCWTLVGPGTAGFWHRRMAVETALHRWDAEHAAGSPGPIDADLAADGLSELVEAMLPRQVDLGRTPPPTTAMRLVSTDRPVSWLVGAGEAVATVSGPSASLLLLLWRRTTRDDPALACDGDLAALDQLLASSLTP